MFLALILSLTSQLFADDKPPVNPRPGQPPIVKPVPITMPPEGSYLLKCRGGGMGFAFEYKAEAANYNRLIISFKQGTKPARQGIEPGECAWTDRAFRAGEPHNFCLEFVKSFTMAAIPQFDGSYNPPRFTITQFARSEDAPYLDKISKPDQYFNLYVTAVSSTCFAVKGIAP